MKRVKGKNSVFIDFGKVDDLCGEHGMTRTQLAAKCGRTYGWYNGLKKKRTTIFAAKLIADVLGVKPEDIIIDPTAPKEHEQTEIEIPKTEMNPEHLIHIAGVMDAFKKQNEIMEKIARQLEYMVVSLDAVADALTDRETDDLDGENVATAESLLMSMTEATGECNAKKFSDACASRSISAPEKARAINNVGAQFQWRSGANGTRKAYIVRGC